MSENKNLTDYELRNLLLQAGWEEKSDAYETIGDIVRLIKAESSGNPRATNFKYPDYSFGLMQVNMLDEPGYLLGEERRKRYNLPDNEALFDPLTNLKVAKGIYDRKGGLKDWGAWTSGAYKDYDYNPEPPLEEKAAEAVNLSENWLNNINPLLEGLKNMNPFKKEEKKPTVIPPLPPIPDNMGNQWGNY